MAALRFGRDGSEYSRGIGFFDAIYAFAITLLIPNIDVPPPQAWASPQALLASGLGDQLLAFGISFVVIALFWRNSTALLARFKAIDGSIITANLAAGALVVLLPFTTPGISDPALDALPLPTALYALNVSLVILAGAVMFELGHARGLLIEPARRDGLLAMRVDAAAQMLIFLLSIPVAYLLGPDWGKACWAAIAIVAPLTGRWVARSSLSE